MLSVEDLKAMLESEGDDPSTMALVLAGTYVPYLIGIIEGQADKIETLQRLLDLEKRKNSRITRGLFADNEYVGAED